LFHQPLHAAAGPAGLVVGAVAQIAGALPRAAPELLRPLGQVSGPIAGLLPELARPLAHGFGRAPDGASDRMPHVAGPVGDPLGESAAAALRPGVGEPRHPVPRDLAPV